MKKKMYAMLVTEFIGTALLTIVVLSIKNSPIGIPYFIALGVGLAYAGLIFFANFEEEEAGVTWIPQFNPALSLALWTVKKIKTVETVLNIALQFAGAYLAFMLYGYLFNNKLPNIAGHYSTRVLLAEALGTFIFVLVIAASVYRKAYVGATSAVIGGIAYTLGIIVASPAAGNALINPAVALGINSFSWNVYVLGPVVGGVIAINLYSLLYTSKKTSVAKVVAKVSSVRSKTKTNTKKKK